MKKLVGGIWTKFVVRGSETLRIPCSTPKICYCQRSCLGVREPVTYDSSPWEAMRARKKKTILKEKHGNKAQATKANARGAHDGIGDVGRWPAGWP